MFTSHLYRKNLVSGEFEPVSVPSSIPQVTSEKDVADCHTRLVHERQRTIMEQTKPPELMSAKKEALLRGASGVAGFLSAPSSPRRRSSSFFDDVHTGNAVADLYAGFFQAGVATAILSGAAYLAYKTYLWAAANPKAALLAGAALASVMAVRCARVPIKKAIAALGGKIDRRLNRNEDIKSHWQAMARIAANKEFRLEPSPFRIEFRSSPKPARPFAELLSSLMPAMPMSGSPIPVRAAQPHPV